ncbi:VWA domain-containing protein [candidate division WOR-3 bacterium]|nr:VWA domain-containing protein [candidate division WOR-3 bacterium]
MTFAQPLYFLLLLLLVPLVYFEVKKKTATICYPDLSYFKKEPNRGVILRYIPFGLSLAVLLLIAFALARPQRGRVYEEIETKGVDIILCMDVSISMVADDFKPVNRLVAARQKANEFIEKRTGDRIGLVIFAGQAMTQCPLTFDHAILRELVDYVDFGMLEDGTAIGLGLATAVSRLKDSRAKEKLIILLTDGANNRGEIDPISAAKIAQAYGIKVYCIGVGSTEEVRTFVNHPHIGRGYFVLEPADLKTLTEIASLTGGQAFHASDAEALSAIYSEIDAMEPTTFKTKKHTVYSEKAGHFMLPAAIILLGAIVLGSVLWRRLP